MTYYSPKQVAKAIGVSEASLKRWCDRGLIQFVKTAGGHRRIPRQEVLQFIRSRGQSLVSPDLLDLPNGTRSQNKILDPNLIYEHFVRGEEKALRSAVIGYYLGGGKLYELWDSVLAPTFHRIGEGWKTGELEIYQERLACEMCIRLLHEVLDVLPEPASDAPSALGASLDSDPYALATLMVETTMREMGWYGRSMGTNLPGETLAKAILDLRPRMFWLSVSAVEDETSFVAHSQKVWDACSQVGSMMVVGGRGLNEQRRAKINYTVFCDHLSDMVNFLEAVGR